MAFRPLTQIVLCLLAGAMVALIGVAIGAPSIMVLILALAVAGIVRVIMARK